MGSVAKADFDAYGLTPREREVLTNLTAGLSNKQIAHFLHISQGTVKEHMVNILRKTGASGRVALAVWWASLHPQDRMHLAPAIVAREVAV